MRVAQTVSKEPDENEIVVFNCGHSFPKSELKTNLCNICSIGESLKVESVILNAKKSAPGSRNKSHLQTNESSANNTRKSAKEEEERGSRFKRHKYLHRMDIYEDIKNDETLNVTFLLI